MLRCAAENRGWNFTLSGNWDGDGELFPARDACGTRLNIGSRSLGDGDDAAAAFTCLLLRPLTAPETTLNHIRRESA